MSNEDRSIEERFMDFLKEPQSWPLLQIYNQLSQPLTSQQMEFIIDSGRNSDWKVYKTHKFVHNFMANTNLILASLSNLFNHEKFAVDLYISITELKSYFVQKNELSKKLGKLLKASEEYLSVIEDLVVKLTAYSESFSEAELDLIEYLRNYYSHLHLGKYNIQWDKKNEKVIDHLNEKPRVQLRKEIALAMADHRESIDEFAQTYAKRIAPQVLEIVELIERWEKLEREENL